MYISRRKFRKNIKKETNFEVVKYIRVLNLVDLKHKFLSISLRFDFYTGKVNYVVLDKPELNAYGELLVLHSYLDDYYSTMKDLGLTMMIKPDIETLKALLEIMED